MKFHIAALALLCSVLFADVSVKNGTFMYREYHDAFELSIDTALAKEYSLPDAKPLEEAKHYRIPDELNVAVPFAEIPEEDWSWDIDSLEYETYEVENEFLKITILPDFGGRLMSIYHKATETEQLYRAPVVVNYALERIFYYHYLGVPGGILSTFPDPEHGRTWNQKWEHELFDYGPDSVAVELFYLDTMDRGVRETTMGYDPYSQYSCRVRITLAKGRQSVGYNVIFKNEIPETDASENQKKYEYWTLTTLTPGSDPDSTFSPKNSKIIAPIDRAQIVSYGSTVWPWMDETEPSSFMVDPVPIDPFYDGRRLSEFEEFSIFENWKGQGILYAYPYIMKNFWGAINLENNIGILRIGPNNTITPGMKFWTWGEPSFDVDLSAPNPAKPHIELWAGHSRRFGLSTMDLESGEFKEWQEYYFPTFDLTDVQMANEYAAIQYSTLEEDGDELVQIKVSSAYPKKRHSVTLKLDDQEYTKEAYAYPDKAMDFKFNRSLFDLPAGSYQGVITVALEDTPVLEFIVQDSSFNLESLEWDPLPDDSLAFKFQSDFDADYKESSSSLVNPFLSSSSDEMSSEEESSSSEFSSSKEELSSSSEQNITPIHNVTGIVDITPETIRNLSQEILRVRIFDLSGKLLNTHSLYPGLNSIQKYSSPLLMILVSQGKNLIKSQVVVNY